MTIIGVKQLFSALGCRICKIALLTVCFEYMEEEKDEMEEEKSLFIWHDKVFIKDDT